ncbi:SCO2400 family protein [Streptomyces rochei]|uniref:SCO2400 family protein n=1 Tax=Streptomyces rochei TaxID=1928 RepID=UPI0033DFD86A
MDYCHPCRRHLNGALACPGCGTPVGELHAPGPESAAVGEVPAPRVEGAEASGGPPAAGRASRRDRKAAAHRRRRRRVLFVTTGFVLAAGGLSLAELGLDAPGSPPRPAAAGGASTDGEASREVGRTSAVPVDATSDTATAAASGTPSPDASATASASASVTASASASRSPSARGPETAEEGDASAPPPASASDEPGTPDRPTPPPDDPPTTTPPTSSAAPDPTPTETCDRFLWWCT